MCKKKQLYENDLTTKNRWKNRKKSIKNCRRHKYPTCYQKLTQFYRPESLRY